MTEKFRFFDAVLQEDGVTYDREYDAQEFTDYFKALVTTGLMKGAGNQLVVTANGSNMITKIDTGIAFLRGRYYENDSFKELTHDTETLGNSRIDRIVIRMDLSTEARYVKAFIKKGVPSTNPVPPALTQTPNLYEISLAQVKVVGGQTFIAANAVTDERGQDIICPWAGSNILPNFNDDALEDLVNSQMLSNGKSTEYLGDYNLLRKSGWYNGSQAWGAKNLPPTGPASYLVEVIAWSGYNEGSVTQFARSSNKPEVTWFRQGFSNGNWNPWTRVTDTLYNIYVDPVNGVDEDGKGWSDGANAYKTLGYALGKLPRLSGYETTLTLAAGTYSTLNLSNYRGGLLTIRGAGATTVIDWVMFSHIDNLQLRDLNAVMGLDLRVVNKFSIQNVNSPYGTDGHGVYCLASSGMISMSTYSSKTSGAGIKLDNGSNVVLDTVSGSGNKIGIDVELSICRRRASSITGTTPTRALNGGQIL
ncbi:pyocin knob domain-containing protein [Lysinibacillus capsici]|uniref:pyocin knob domain-containing protein n=1 Tax=Lysinibacillus capsici TaxID=2115968 RepID=UPI000E20692C|nr:pyocin knob domain-containing protein [Lysinibacillus capsici]RDV27662.1 hypothetical protein C7B89_19700 [Lysinibacillus capsici]